MQFQCQTTSNRHVAVISTNNPSQLSSLFSQSFLFFRLTADLTDGAFVVPNLRYVMTTEPSQRRLSKHLSLMKTMRCGWRSHKKPVSGQWGESLLSVLKTIWCFWTFECRDVRSTLNAPKTTSDEAPPAGWDASLQSLYFHPARRRFFFGCFVVPGRLTQPSYFCSCLGSFLRSFPAFLFLFLLRKFSSLPLFFSSWYFSASCSFFFSAVQEQQRRV